MPDDSDVDVEGLPYNADGVVIFDGGAYSAGPEFIGPRELKLLPATDGEEGDGAAPGTSPVSAAAASAQGGSASGGDDEDEGEDSTVTASTSTSIVEQSLVDWGSRLRMRCKVTLRIGHLPDNGEVDVEVRPELNARLHMKPWILLRLVRFRRSERGLQ